MPLSKTHKAETRQKIIEAAGRLFRKAGYEGTSVNNIMSAAGLTHGGFYAHFNSKAALFEEVLANSHDLLRRLKARDFRAKDSLEQQCKIILSAYLAEENFHMVAPNCTFASLSSDASRVDKDGKMAYTNALKIFHNELLRGKSDRLSEDDYDESALRIMALSIGALTLARTSGDENFSKAMLRAAQAQVSDWCG